MKAKRTGSTLRFNLEKWKAGTLLWKHMIMMVSILLLAVIALTIILGFSLRTLTEEQLSKMQIILERNCQQMEEELYMTIALPSGIEGTRYYDYIKGERSGELDRKYYPVLPLLRRSLNNQIYLRGSSTLSLLYLSGVNSIVSSTNNYPVAEDCFERDILFSDTSPERILAYLREKNSLVLLPMQDVSIDGAERHRYMTLVVHPVERNVAVMSLYSEEQVLEYVGMSYMPDDCYVKITAQDGQILEEYPAALDTVDAKQYHTLEGQLRKLGASVCLYIPKSYCSTLIAPVRHIGIAIIVFVFLVGLAMSFFLSKVSVVPIRKLISSHESGADTFQGNEITHLDQIISRNINRSIELQAKFARQIIARAMTGSVLSDADEQQLMQSGLIPASYRIAILHTNPQRNENLGIWIKAELGEMTWVYLNNTEMGLILPSDDSMIARLTDLLDAANRAVPQPGAEIYCGVSAPAENVTDLHMAVYQARVAMPQSPGVNLFFGESVSPPALSWLQHERLYQNIFSNNREGVVQMLFSIVKHADSKNARDLFYNIKFVLCSAAGEMKLDLPMEDCMDYQASKLPRENIEKLLVPLDALFDAIDEQKKERRVSLANEMLRYIQKELSAYDLCAQTVAEHFEITEKRVYETVRKAVDMSFNEYLLSIRMKYAGSLLCSTQDSIADIAQQCGYQSSSTFYRVFNKYYGMPPGRFRDVGGTDQEKNSEPR